MHPSQGQGVEYFSRKQVKWAKWTCTLKSSSLLKVFPHSGSQGSWLNPLRRSHTTYKEGGGDELGAGEEAPSCSESFSSSLCVWIGDSCSSLQDAMLRSFSGEGCALWSLSLWEFSSFSELKLFLQGSHLGFTTMTDFSDPSAVSSSAFVAARLLSSLLFFSLLSWLGDFFFLTQELLASSFKSKLKLSLPILRLKENLWLLLDSRGGRCSFFLTMRCFNDAMFWNS